jgi:NAD(P)-dependent dehydrogenase (short-subunit alcohol dehydrogenase family)
MIYKPMNRMKRIAVNTSVIVGGSNGIGRHLAQRHADRGHSVFITSRDAARAKEAAAHIDGNTTGLAMNLAEPETIAGALQSIGEVDHLVISAVPQYVNTFADFDIAQAVEAVTVKLVGYTATIRALRDRFTSNASVVLFGGLAKDRPYPGSTMVTTFNGGIATLINTLAVEMAPYRVNAIHPGVVGDSPKWLHARDTHPHVQRTPIGRLVTMDEVVDAVDFLLSNGGMNGSNLYVDGGLLTS